MIQIEGRPDVIIDLTTKNALEELKSKPFNIKEGATFRMKARFKVQHQILSGLKYVQVIKRMGISNKMQEMIVSGSNLSVVDGTTDAATGLILSKHGGQARVRKEM